MTIKNLSYKPIPRLDRRMPQATRNDVPGIIVWFWLSILAGAGIFLGWVMSLILGLLS